MVSLPSVFDCQLPKSFLFIFLPEQAPIINRHAPAASMGIKGYFFMIEVWGPFVILNAVKNLQRLDNDYAFPLWLAEKILRCRSE